MDAIAIHALSSAVTPFLDRPAEIRNAIYETLFQHDEPVVLVVKPETRMKRRLMRRAIFNRELLYTCKQIFLEASSIIYANNTWLVTFGPGRHTYNCSLLHKVGEWLARIGTTRNLLRRIEIEISTDFRHCTSHDSLNILALTRHAIPLQRQQSPKLSVKFIPGRFQPLSDSRSEPTFNYESISQAFDNLTPAIPWDLQVYLRCRRSLSSVRITGNGTGIEVKLRTRMHNEIPRVVYEMSEDRQLRRVPALKRLVDLHRILEIFSIRQNILDRITHSEETITYDLNRHTTSYALGGAFRVDRRVRAAAIGSFSGNNFAIKLTDPHQYDEDFDRLYNFLWCYYPVRGVWARAYESACLLIEINLGEEEGLHDVRFKAIEFAETTRNLLEGVEVYVQLVGADSPLGKQVSRKSLGCMRDQLLQFFILLIDIFPDRHLWPCPTIWMDYQGYPIEAHFLQNGRRYVVRNNMVEEPSYEMVLEYIHQLQQEDGKLLGRSATDTLVRRAISHAQMYWEWYNEPEV